MPAVQNKPIVLIILDGWGIAPPGPGNAIAQAKVPNMSRFWKECVHTQLIAHGESVGLPKSEPGNTETGHLNMGAGRIVYQDLPRINMAIADGSFFQNDEFRAAIKHAKTNKSRLHVMGLAGGGGVHSDLSHLFALLRMCHEANFSEVFLHLFTDGRDSPPTAAMSFITQIKSVMSRESVGQIASVMGRYYAMDRDFRWDRTAKAYFCLTRGEGKTAESIETAVSSAYSDKKTDEFIEPTLIVKEGVIKDNDAVIFFNFRIDRPRQLTKAFVLPKFDDRANVVGFDPYAVEYVKKHEVSGDSAKQKPFDRGAPLKNLYFVTMTEYEQKMPAKIAFPPQAVESPLGDVISRHGLKQLRITESEKERFVTYYFNGQQEEIFKAEDREIIPSPKVATYDLKPEMSSRELTDKIIENVRSKKYDLIIVNYPNADMVGHTGVLKATIKGCEAVDLCMGDLEEEIVNKSDGIMLITADHGNAEEMVNRSTGDTDTEHNSNPVPLIVIGKNYRTKAQLPQGILADIAPTILSLLNLSIPAAMTGKNLLATLDK
jgi:2,3-bisphosphoglycerate-independent phosphoglycerate mutase